MDSNSFYKFSFARAVTRISGISGLQNIFGNGAVPPEIEEELLELPIDSRFRFPSRDPVTNQRVLPVDYGPVDSGVVS
jgi:hypothetical protein